MYSQLQPWSQPGLDDLVGKRIDVLSSFEMEDGTVKLRWCQGEVLSVVEGERDPTVEVEWDPMTDVSGYEESQVGNQRLMPSLWKKDKQGGWRVDVEVDVSDEESYDESSSEIEEEGGDELSDSDSEESE